MKKYIITTNGNEIKTVESAENFCEMVLEGESITVSDGYHTMDELYEHRTALFIALCHSIDKLAHGIVYRSRKHSDGSVYEGWFILGIGKEKGKQLTYHLPNIKWDEVSSIETLDKAPEYDGHTSKDVLERLTKVMNITQQEHNRLNRKMKRFFIVWGVLILAIIIVTIYAAR